MAFKYKKEKIPKTKKIIKLKTKNFFRIVLELKKLGFIALRYKYVKMPKTKKTIKLKIKNFFRIELELKKLDFIN